jgi:hypothetical protein
MSEVPLHVGLAWAALSVKARGTASYLTYGELGWNPPYILRGATVKSNPAKVGRNSSNSTEELELF